MNFLFLQTAERSEVPDSIFPDGEITWHQVEVLNPHSLNLVSDSSGNSAQLGNTAESRTDTAPEVGGQ